MAATPSKMLHGKNSKRAILLFTDGVDNASEHSALEMADAISRVIDPAQSLRRQELIELGANISAQYLPEKILPKWKDFLENLQGQEDAG
mgnify:CR=1 FL=1